MSPCQHGEGGTGVSQHPPCPFACLGSPWPPPQSQHSSNKVIYSHTSGVTPLWGTVGTWGQQGIGATISSPAIPRGER